MDARSCIVLASVICLTLICISALAKGIDSTVVGVVCSTLGTILGYYLGKKG